MREERDMQAPFDMTEEEQEQVWDEFLDEEECDEYWEEEYDEDVERDWMLAQQELEDFEQADEYFGGGCEHL